ncbi:MAG: hypothetical protein AB8B95_00645 [Pseudohongiellaceae bacterium]
MFVVAVVELDWLLSQHKERDSIESGEHLSSQVVALKQCNNVDKWIFTVSDNSNPLPQALHEEFEIRVVDDVELDPLSAFYQAAHCTRPDAANNPLILKLKLSNRYPSPSIIDSMIENHIEQRHHYSRNQKLVSDPDHLLEIMNFDVLDEAWREAILPDDRSQVTPYIYRQQQRLNVGYFPPVETALSPAQRMAANSL